MFRALKPFIRRDYVSRPLRLRLLQEIVAYPHRYALHYITRLVSTVDIT